MQQLGRPPLPLGEKLDCSLSIALDRETHERLKREARTAGYRSLASYVRDRFFETEAPRRSSGV